MIETEADWLSCTDLEEFNRFFRSIVQYPQHGGLRTAWKRLPSDRKMRLWLVACCRLVWEVFDDQRYRGVINYCEENSETIDRTKLGELLIKVDEVELGDWNEPKWPKAAEINLVAAYLTEANLWETNNWGPIWLSCIRSLILVLNQHGLETKTLSATVSLLHEVLGNPFRPIDFDSSWCTTNVRDLAKTIYEEKAFERMPILADALMDAGCNSDDILIHCHGPGPHVRGCWVLDLILGKE